MALQASRWIGLVLLGGAAAAFLIERLVVTDREAIEDLVQAAVGAVANGDFVGLRDYLDEEYSADGRDRDGAARYVEEQVRKHKPTNLGAVVKDVKVTDDRARARIEVRGRIMYRGRVDVTLDLVRRDAGWRILAAREGARVIVPRHPFGD